MAAWDVAPLRSTSGLELRRAEGVGPAAGLEGPVGGGLDGSGGVGVAWAVWVVDCAVTAGATAVSRVTGVAAASAEG